ncbi:Uncharacterized protein PBTT_08890 [Plasmodiophora brassicae]
MSSSFLIVVLVASLMSASCVVNSQAVQEEQVGTPAPVQNAPIRQTAQQQQSTASLGQRRNSQTHTTSVLTQNKQVQAENSNDTAAQRQEQQAAQQQAVAQAKQKRSDILATTQTIKAQSPQRPGGQLTRPAPAPTTQPMVNITTAQTIRTRADTLRKRMQSPMTSSMFWK